MDPRKAILHFIFSVLIIFCVTSVLADRDVRKTPISMEKNHTSFANAKNISDFIPPAPRSFRPPCRPCRIGKFIWPCCRVAAKVANDKGTNN